MVYQKEAEQENVVHGSLIWVDYGAQYLGTTERSFTGGFLFI